MRFALTVSGEPEQPSLSSSFLSQREAARADSSSYALSEWGEVETTPEDVVLRERTARTEREKGLFFVIACRSCTNEVKGGEYKGPRAPPQDGVYFAGF